MLEHNNRDVGFREELTFSWSGNDQVHAAGAIDVDFKTDAAARSRAAHGSSTFVACDSNW
jgi:hypothetical protein